MISSDSKTVTLEREFSCSVEKLYRAWSPEELPKWWKALKIAEMEMKAGGKIRFQWHQWDGLILGTFKEVIPNKKLAFSWKSNSPNSQESLVIISFEKSGEGSKLSVAHTDNADAEEARDHNHGWTDCLVDLDFELNPLERSEFLELERTIEAPVTMVFEAWTNPEIMVKWWNGSQLEKARVQTNLKKGGSYTLDYFDEQGQNHQHFGEYLEISKPEKLVFTWISDYSTGRTQVTLNLSEDAGKTRLRLKHEFFRTTKAREQHVEGWNDCLNAMAGMVVA